MTNKKYTIGVVTPFLSGFILGELSGHLRAFAQENGVNLIMIRANGYGHYDLPLALNYIDGLIIRLDSASPKLVEAALAKGIPVISSSTHYTNMKVELSYSDQSQGIRDAFAHLIQQGHKRIGFAGELNNIDIQMRYQAYKEQLKHWGLPYTPAWVLDTHDLNMAGGREAGRLYLQGLQDCTAMICATDLIAIGMMEQIKKSGIQVPQDLALIGVDNTFLGSSCYPTLTSVDQNVEHLAQRAITRLVERLDGAPYHEEPYVIQQKLVIRESCGAPAAQQTSNHFFHKNAAQEESSTTDPSESVMAMAQSGLDSILNLSSIYGPFLKWGCFARWEHDKNTKLYIQEFFSESSEDIKLNANQRVECLPEEFPPKELFQHSLPEHFVITLVPIEVDRQYHWGTLAIVDDMASETSMDAYKMFNNYLDLLSLFIERDALVESIQQREQKARSLTKQLEAVSRTSNDGIFNWDIRTNQVEWNNRLLEMLGFTEQDERKQHRHMNLFDRMHPEDESQIRSLITAHIHEGTHFRATFRLLSRHNGYLWVEAGGELLSNELGEPERFVGSMTDVTEQRNHQQRIQHMAYHDALTGLPNRAMLNEKLKSHIKNSSDHPVSIMLMDLNRFKFINDTYGHDTGDALLKHVARTLQPVLRSRDFFARFGGDEFVFVCDLYKEEQALDLAERILKAVETRFVHKGIELSSQGSIGIAFYPKDGATADDLIKKADIAMYRAKSQDKAKAVLFNSTMNDDVQRQVTLEHQLKLAIEQEQLDVHFQPQFSSISGRLLGVEALARWHSPTLGPVSPALFVPAAENSGLIEKLGQQISMKAMKTVAKWHARYPQLTLKLSINVSPGQLMLPDFSGDLLDWVNQSNFNPERLVVEITESAAISDLEHSRIMLKQLTTQGIEVSLDDFGTGYSSLSLLNQLPLHWIKIDRAFMKNLETDKSSQDVIRSIVMVCHSFGFQTVAEGVETSRQLEIVKNIGCDAVQGFVYSPALNAEAFETNYLISSLAAKG